MNQSSFDFDVASATPPATPVLEPSTPSFSTSPTAGPVPVLPALTLHEMAQQLEQHPDFRVLRRLVPQDHFGAAPAAPRTVRVLVLDTETTGLSHRTDKIIELAMLLVQVDALTGLPFGPVEVFEGFEDPGMPIPPIAKEVTGISDDMVQGHRLDDAGVEAMVARADLVVAHNAGFDRPFLEARFAVFADQSWACSFADIDWRAAGAGSSKLSALAQDHGWFYDAHRAQVDCHALLQVLTRPVPGTAATGLAQLIAAANRPSCKLRATGAPFESKDLLKARGYRWDAEARVWCCTLTDTQRLDEERAWLKAEVYGRRSAQLDIEALDSRVRYSARPGLLTQQPL